MELLPHPLRNATHDSTVETWTTAVSGCDNGLLNNEDYRPHLEWKYAAAMPVCDRPDARPSSLQPVSTVNSNHGSDPGAQGRSEGVLQLHCREPKRLEYPLEWREVHAIA